VSDEFIEELKRTKEDGKIRMGLVKDYLLLNELNDDLGKYYVENEKKIKEQEEKILAKYRLKEEKELEKLKLKLEKIKKKEEKYEKD